MTRLQPVLAILVALFSPFAHADLQTVPRAFQADFYLPGCKDFLAADPIS
jgi:hypothetical protein